MAPNHDIEPEEIERRFSYHDADETKRANHEALREEAKEFAESLLDRLPAGREKSLAFTALEEATFWAHAAIAREGT